MAANSGGTVVKHPEAARRLCRWVVPLRICPTIKTGGNIDEFRSAGRIQTRSAAVNGVRHKAVVNAMETGSKPLSDGGPLRASSEIKVTKSLPQSGWNRR
jgi:hypothetical protein